MNKKNKKILLVLLVSAAFIIAAFALVMLVTTSTTEVNTKTGEDASERSTKSSTSAKSPEKEEAEKLIDQTLSREKIEKKVGSWEEFEMDGNGCERGVYAGKFYYEDFTIFSRTYDKGKTFRIISVN